jgi:hypothetical protein
MDALRRGWHRVGLRRSLVHGMSVVPVAVEDVLVNGVALLCVNLASELVRESVEDLLPITPHR